MNRHTSSTPSPSPRTISTVQRVLLVDDHPAIREALREIIDSKLDIEICGEARSAQEALEVLERTHTDVAVVDVSLEDMHGLDLVQDIRNRHPHTKVLVFSMYDEELYAERAIRAGASGYLMKSEPTQRIADAIRHIVQGHIYLSRNIATQAVRQSAGSSRSAPGFALDELTRREKTVFELLGQGRDIREIAERLDVQVKTAQMYRRRAKEKLNLNSVGELLQYAVRWTNS